MKNYLKSIGAALAYLILYFLIIFLVAFGLMIYKGFSLALESPFMDLEARAEAMAASVISNIIPLTILSNLICFFTLLLITKLRKKTLKERLDLAPAPLRSLWPLLVIGITLNLLLELILIFLPIPESAMADYEVAVSGINQFSVLGAVLSVIVAPIFEEVLLRGYIMKTLQKGFPTFLAVIIQAVIFGLLHTQIIWIVYASLVGVLLGLIKIRYQSLYPCVLLHFAFNASNYLIIPLMTWAGNSVLGIIGLMILAVAITIFMGKLILERTQSVKEPSAVLGELPLES